ncbi:MAG: hypothetical protein CL392_11535 [Acidiferrobacteraceae bacterium]|nr:hypothetical protein [Acidiferrobacteraceae bacterium]|tara:strand:+ start:1053 stop:1238 length:186 start_codon:yes stop_codon:yes gene_type:complete
MFVSLRLWVCCYQLGGYIGNLAYSISNSNYDTHILIVNGIQSPDTILAIGNRAVNGGGLSD